ncbi:MAG: replication initiator protein A [Ruminococcus sp.]
MQLSIRNHWIDETGKVYIYFTVESIMEALVCGNKKWDSCWPSWMISWALA